MTVLLFAVFVCKAEVVDGTVFLKSLNGTYIELFSTNTCLKPELKAVWHTEAAKHVGEDKADDIVRQLIEPCKGTFTGDKTVVAYANGQDYKFCCSFLQGVMNIKGNRISGEDKQGKKLFSHKYHFVEKNSEGSYVFESNDGNNDEFHFFRIRPDSPRETYHIVFRYCSGKEQLKQLMTGKYAYWMASALREPQEDEYGHCILLFVGEKS